MRHILRHVLSNGCARNVNWKGRGGKTAFCHMELCRVIKSKSKTPVGAHFYYSIAAGKWHKL